MKMKIAQHVFEGHDYGADVIELKDGEFIIGAHEEIMDNGGEGICETYIHVFTAKPVLTDKEGT